MTVEEIAARGALIIKLFNEAAELMQKRNYSSAIEKLEKIMEIDPNNAGAYSTRAAAYSDLAIIESNKSKYYDKIIADLEKAVELDPTEARYRERLNKEKQSVTANSNVSSSPPTDSDKPNRFLQIIGFVIGCVVSSLIIGFIFGLIFGKGAIITNILRIAGALVGGIFCFNILSPAKRTHKQTRSWLLLIILLIISIPIFLSIYF